MAWLGTFKYRRKLSISNTQIDELLSGFPIRVHLSSSSGTGSTDLTDIFTELGADANRKKIAITTSDEVTQCYVEIELFDFANTDAEYWVSPSVVPDSITELYFYYDSSQADNATYVGDTGDAPAQSVWDANFVGVWHMAQDPNGDVADAIKDSTSNANHGTPSGSMTTADLVDGKIGKAIDFDGDNDKIAFTKVLESPTEVTFEIITKANNTSAEYRCLVHNNLEPYAVFMINAGAVAGDIRIYLNSSSGVLDITSAKTVTDYNYLAVTGKENDFARAFIDEVQIGSDVAITTFASVPTNNNYIGCSRSAGNFLFGIGDEVRISDIVRSAAWLKATYYSNWDGLILYGDTEENKTIISLTSPLAVESIGQCNIKVKIVPPSLSAVSSMSVTKIFKGYIVRCIEALTGESAGQSNIKVKIKPPSPLSSTGSLSVSKIFKGYILHLVDSLKGESSGNSNIKVGLKSGTFGGASTGKSNIKVSIKPGPLSATTSMNVVKISTFVKRIAKAITSFGEQSQDGISAALGIEDKQPIRLDLSPGAQEIQKILHKLCIGDPFVSLQTLENKLVDDKREVQKVLNIISDSVESIHAISQTISSGDVVSLQKLLLEIVEKDYVSGQQNILQSLENLSVAFPSVEYDILLDGVSIKKNIIDVIVSYREDSAHNSVGIRSTDKQLFWNCDPANLEGTSRIEVQVGTRQIYFLLEKRTGDEKSFSFWGRSLSAREDKPYAEDIDYALEDPKSAKAVVEEILTVSSLDWRCDDWILPISFEFEGPPMEGILQIANAIGAVVRCKDDGTILIRQKFPIRPINMNGADVAVNYDRSNLTRLDYENYKSHQYNAVEVVGFTDDVGLPDIYIAESSPKIGDSVHLQVYWAGRKPSGIIDTYVTDGLITSIEGEAESQESETVVFMNGIAMVSKPITSIIRIAWIGESGGEISYKKHSKDLEIVDGAYRIATITYTATWSQYRLSYHYISVLLALLTFGGESDVTVEVKIGEGDNPAPSLSLPLLTSQSIAIVAGTAWLDANKYDQKQVVLEAPYNEDAVDGVLVFINNAEIDCVGNFHILVSRIVMKGPKVTNELGVIQCQV